MYDSELQVIIVKSNRKVKIVSMQAAIGRLFHLLIDLIRSSTSSAKSFLHFKYNFHVSESFREWP